MFRNKLVHVYGEVSEEEIKGKLGETDFLKKFVEEVLGFLKKKGYLS